MKRAGKKRGLGRDWPPGRSRLRTTISSLAALAALLPLATAPPAAAAEADAPEPARVLTISPLWPVIPLKFALGGSLCQSDSCDPVPYVPFWTANGVTLLDRQLAGISDSDGPTVVFGYSNGALVALDWMAENADAPQDPSPAELSFVLIGNPARGYGGTVTEMSPSGYDVMDIVRQYDPVADFPNKKISLLALANIAAGIVAPQHLDYSNVDINDPANTTWTEGTTTYVFVPTERLPLLTPLRLIGMGWLADALNEPLKEIVERSYERPYLATEPTDEPDVPPVGADDADPADPPAAGGDDADPAVTEPADAPAVEADDAAPADLPTAGDGEDATAGTSGEPEAPSAAAVTSPDELADAMAPGDPTDTITEEAAPDDADTAKDTFEADTEQPTDEETTSDEPASVDITPEQSADTQQPETQETSGTSAE